ncbi:hypothetical protein [Bizionia myxarmorum]|uniref:Porin family protein n=1 Tax=Bizionia myxarmorum TaxID=291186 RepID=A0A5D0R5J3_9FLAO|nr:hypothetical protein [Bizionia myxarmorum]TYB76910.1 hypothetical protein ES674_09410 [Bizionia myxarmorum]
MIPKSFFLFSVLFIMIFTSHLAKAQPNKGHHFKASIGLGVSIPFDEVDVSSVGFYTQGEYVFGITRWFGIRPYAGLMLASSTNNDVTLEQYDYKVSTNAFLLGGKIRLAIPIPWVAPYLETGIGVSLGSFKTITTLTNIEKDGFIMHIPVTYGLAIGRNHNFEIEITFYYHPTIDQYAAAAALGFSFPI